MRTPIKCVVDTSVCIKHFIPDPLSSKVDQLLAHVGNTQIEFFVPDLFYIECANTLWKYVRAELYPTTKVSADLTTLKAFDFRIISTADLMADAISLALAHNISAYDASYVALSQQVGATLLTLDLRLVRALGATSYVCLFNVMTLRFQRCPEFRTEATLTYLLYLKLNEQNYHKIFSNNTVYLLDSLS